MPGKTLILRGLPGAGKSTVTAGLVDPIICSADHLFETPDGYKYDRSKLGAAHRECLRKFAENIETEQTLVVDNTNIYVVDIAPYYALSAAYGRETVIVTVMVDVATSCKRNTHGVPASIIEQMAYGLYREDERFPAYWVRETIQG